MWTGGGWLAVTNITDADVSATAAIAGSKLGAGSIAKDRLKTVVHEVAFSTLEVVGGQQNLNIVNPTIAFPKATYDLLSLFVKNLSSPGDTQGGAWAMADDSGTNWGGRVVVRGNVNATFSATLVFVFISKT